ncbi:N-formylglutamate deformylase|uniref:N-formylglutamate deformylase n=1 Tax=Brenneria salicis ATCC 15712 = DSM 30166 TaxID=714314 RepID=A0A366IA95_9GAMM|nr:N-formylglutamate deformylase [Brenneria salicis]NMN91725.1 N-formylglutamate deformylase [Brenneria salicis ATCC 15712 = DSM 30166]RBP65783.1 N-formylglutamate deformylase [Brenneria salicis ATCC 15712 = DSM 30166]RLM31823.1 N-formylglutamate deformylase [Brenneria salicis ATCC 15712 = DSM 30166]
MTETEDYIFHRGTAPLFVTMPHTGTAIPAHIAGRLTPEAQSVPDTDWHIEKLYAFAKEMGASILQAKWSRYVVDLNRPPNNESLYPGQATTGLCPVNLFDGGEIYLPGCLPDAAEIARRREQYWQPWHDKLQATLKELCGDFPRVVMWDAHSIRSVLPQFFSGKLPDFSIGTNNGTSCDQRLERQITNIAQQSPLFTAVNNGRYKGGYITRNYSDQSQGIHTLQMELTQSTYMQEVPPWVWNAQHASNMQERLRLMLESTIEFAQHS